MKLWEICGKHVEKDGGGPTRGPPPSFSTDVQHMFNNFYMFSPIRPVHEPYEFIGFGDIHGPKPYEFIGFGDLHHGSPVTIPIKPVPIKAHPSHLATWPNARPLGTPP